MNKLLMTTAALLIATSAAYAEGDCIGCVNTPREPKQFEFAPVKVNPMDYSGTINQSPIRGRGRIKVVHNEPDPNEAEAKAEITKARWLLQDNGYQCSVPRVSRR